MIEAPGDRLVGGWARIGVISEDGGGLALLAGGAKTFTRIESHGDGDAERLLPKLIEGWRERGRPTGHDLRVEASFQGGAGSDVRLSWAPSLGVRSVRALSRNRARPMKPPLGVTPRRHR